MSALNDNNDLLNERINIRGEIEGIHATLTEREKALNDRWKAQERATELAMTELQRRLDTLNHAHEQAREKEADFVQFGLYDQAHKVLEDKIGMLQTGQARLSAAGGIVAIGVVANLVKLWFG